MKNIKTRKLQFLIANKRVCWTTQLNFVLTPKWEITVEYFSNEITQKWKKIELNLNETLHNFWQAQPRTVQKLAKRTKIVHFVRNLLPQENVLSTANVCFVISICIGCKPQMIWKRSTQIYAGNKHNTTARKKIERKETY